MSNENTKDGNKQIREKDNANKMWKFLKEDQTFYLDENAVFTFIVKREKHPQTHEEKLIITCENEGEENGTIITNLLHLRKDISQFLKYGVILNETDFDELARQIQKNYLEIKYSISNIRVIDDNIIKGVLELVNEYIELASSDKKEEKDKEKGKDKEKEFTIPVKEFEDLLSEDYGDFDCKEIRKALVEKNYIITQKGRTSKLVRRNGKPTRVIAFDLSKLKG